LKINSKSKKTLFIEKLVFVPFVYLDKIVKVSMRSGQQIKLFEKGREDQTLLVVVVNDQLDHAIFHYVPFRKEGGTRYRRRRMTY